MQKPLTSPLPSFTSSTRPTSFLFLFSITTNSTARGNRSNTNQTNQFGWLCLEISNSSATATETVEEESYSWPQFGKIKAGQYVLILTECSIVSEALSSTKYMPHFPTEKNSHEKIHDIAQCIFGLCKQYSRVTNAKNSTWGRTILDRNTIYHSTSFTKWSANLKTYWQFKQHS